MVIMNIRENVAISGLSTMRLGGVAKYVVEITTSDEVAEAYQFAVDHGLPVFVLGAGSNTIGRDEGYDGVILQNCLTGIEVLSETDDEIILRAGSGEVLDDLCDFASKRGFTGIEAISGIPGTVGGAVYQNSGAYGQDLSQVLTEISVYDGHERRFITLSRDDLGLSYRDSFLKKAEPNRYFVVSVTIKLRCGEIEGDLYESLQDYLDQHDIEDRAPYEIRRAVIDIRSHKLPDPAVTPSAGSFFHNVIVTDDQAAQLRAQYPDVPIFNLNGQNEVSSGWLIEQAGLKGRTLYGIRVSDKAALILTNESAKSYADLAAARDEICVAVKQKFGLDLIQEPIEI
ncbi:UDP-N-acetylenolpyruvoylglucosamine reductase [Alphaproteobacteria bacterium]|nr:UDP-N-acetylenolpyruvoylglucosamine reductase [Alphaproteobacteria bacterium]